MERRRIKRDASTEELPVLDTYCAECLKFGVRERQRDTPTSGPTCKYGHGGAEGIPTHRHEAENDLPEHPRPFEVRDGDTLVIHYGGANLQIAQYNNVELDSATYSRKLEAGDDPEAEYERIHDFLKKQVTGRARAKLAMYADELAKARARARG